MKTTKITFWVSTGILAIMEGVLPAFTSQSEIAKQSMMHLGYPFYFGTSLAVFKVLGVLAIIIPQVPRRIKDAAYTGFSFAFLFASISNFAIDGFKFQGFFPLIFLGILALSYRSSYKLNYSPDKLVTPTI